MSELLKGIYGVISLNVTCVTIVGDTTHRP